MIKRSDSPSRHRQGWVSNLEARPRAKGTIPFRWADNADNFHIYSSFECRP